MHISKEHITYAFRPDLAAVAVVPSGSFVTFETIDAVGGQITTEQDTVNSLDFSKVNPATGPIAVEGAEPGDALRVDILEINTASQGVMLAVPGLGVLGDQVSQPQTKVVRIDEHHVYFNDLRIRKEPMIGVIGVATQSEEIPCGTPGDHGGNMDTKEICPGNSLLLPVFQPGGQLELGDVHAAMGDGEICGTGVECGAEVVVKVTLIKGLKLQRPLLDTPTEIQSIASCSTLEEASKLATADMVNYLMRQKNLTFNEAYMLTSIAGNAKISQLVDPLLTVRMAISKAVL